MKAKGNKEFSKTHIFGVLHKLGFETKRITDNGSRVWVVSNKDESIKFDSLKSIEAHFHKQLES